MKRDSPELFRGGGSGLMAPDRSDRVSTLVRAYSREMLMNPRRAICVFWAAGLTSIVAMLLAKRWSHPSFISLVILAAVCGTVFIIRMASQFPDWTLHVDVGLAMLVASTLAIVGATDHVNLSIFYIWIGLYAAMYLSTFAVFAYIGGVALSYALVLGFGPKVGDPITTWLVLFNSMTLVTAVVFGLVSVLRATSREDALTGLANRRWWDERLNEELERSRRTGQAVSLVMIDLDGFKAVNDREGHDTGDKLLRELARAWQRALRGGGDFLARIGGDEFSVLAPGSDELGIRRLAERLVDALPRELRCSYGVATWDGSEDRLSLLKRADQSIYQEKLRHRAKAERRQA